MYRPKIAIASVTAAVTLLASALPALAGQPENRSHSDWRTTPKLYYPAAFDAAGARDAVGVAEAFLAQRGGLFAVPSAPDDLRLEGTRQSLTATHVRFQQYLAGIPVENAEIVVSLHPDLQVWRVFNNLYPVLDEPLERTPAIGAADALDIAWNHLRVHGELLDVAPSAELLWQPQGMGFRLIYRTLIAVEAPFGHWEVRVDARTGEVLETRRTELSRMPTPKTDFEVWSGDVSDRGAAEQRRAERQAEAPPVGESGGPSGSGEVFDPDPRTTLQDNSLVDTSPASAFTAAYQTRTLLDLTNDAGTYRLIGPWVQIVNFESPATAPSTTTDGVWTALRGNNAFNDVMTYFHIDQSQRYIQNLGFTGASGIQEGSIQVDSDGLSGADNSHYIPGTNQLAFGHGCVDDNEDADVILHEYGHAIQHDINPSWSGGDTGAMGEGFGDYWAGSYSYSTPNGTTYHPTWVFTWDGHLGCWAGRVMDITGQYDPGSTYPAHSTVNGVDGDELWSTPLFTSLVDLIGLGKTREEVDKIVLESHFGLGSGLSMPDMAQSTVDAATALYPAGPHASVFQGNFADHNILSLPSIPAFSVTAPGSGASLPGGSQTTVSWTTAGAPGDTVYTVDYTDQCTPAVAFSDDMENDGSGWAVSHAQGSSDWALGTASPHSGAKAWFAADVASLTDQYLTTGSPIAIGAGAELHFWHSYTLESSYDGGVVEISTDGGSTWDDLGPAMTVNGYSGSISSSFGSPIGGRQAFTGAAPSYQETVADLSAWAGASALIRFRMASDESVGSTGWYVDDVSVLSGGEWFSIGASAPGASSMPWDVPLVTGDDYCVRVEAAAPGYSGASAVSDNFSVTGGADLIFADDFESGDTTAWSSVTP